MTKKTFKYSLISDLHLDHPQPKTPYDLFENNIIVAGDTTNGLTGLKFLNKLKNKGFNVFACDGNHEHYANAAQGRTIEETTKRFTDSFKSIVDIDDKLSIICLNSWYFVHDPYLWHTYMNDNKRATGKHAIDGANIVNNTATFQSAVIGDLLESFHDRKFIIVTHTAPCLDTLDPKFKGHYSNEWYWNPYNRINLSNHRDKILVWNHGHTHSSNEAIVDGVRVACNPRGYPGENPDWKPLTIEVNYD